MKAAIRVLLAFLSFGNFWAQETRVLLDPNKSLGSADKSEVFQTSCLGGNTAASQDINWLSTLQKAHEPQLDFNREQNSQNESGSQSKPTALNRPTLSQGTTKNSPVIGNNWHANFCASSGPLDNNIAISNDGVIVSVSNPVIEIYDEQGNLTYYNDLMNFFNLPGVEDLGDPVVLYDPLADKFIIAMLEFEGIPATRKICIAFSKTNNPAQDGWWRYTLPAAPLINSTYLDYPKIGISTYELYITGNLMNTNNGSFNQAIIYQIDKNDGFSGNNLTWQFWHNLAGIPSNLYPVGNGHGEPYGPGCYFLSTNRSGGNQIKLYEITNDMSSNLESTNYFEFSCTPYSKPTDANQLGSDVQLDIRDCRIQSAFYLDGLLHFVFQSDVLNGWSGINYNRLDLNSSVITTSIFGAPEIYDYAYPSMASIGDSHSDRSVLFSYLCSSPDIYPELRTVICNDNMQWSASALVKQGDGYLNSYFLPTKARWGDYSGTCRKYNANPPEAWISGAYGNSAYYLDNWIAQVHVGSVGLLEPDNPSQIKIGPNPAFDQYFVAFEMQQQEKILICLFDANGNKIKDLFEGQTFSGKNQFTFNKNMLSSGIYTIKVLNAFMQEIYQDKIILID
jgi:hypothetical protein